MSIVIARSTNLTMYGALLRKMEEVLTELFKTRRAVEMPSELLHFVDGAFSVVVSSFEAAFVFCS